MTKRGVNCGAGPHEGKRFRYFSDGPIEDLGPVDAGRSERADEQATRTSGHSTDDFQVSADMRAMVEKSVEQAQQAFDGFIGAAQRALDMFGETAGKGAKDVAEKAMTFAEKDMAISFDFARKLVRARGVQEVLKLHTEYIMRRCNCFPSTREQIRHARRNETSASRAREKISEHPFEKISERSLLYIAKR